MGLTTDSNDPNLNVKDLATGQNKAYLVLSDEELQKGFVEPVRDTYWHEACKTTTVMGGRLAETYARKPSFYSHTFCASCRNHFPVEEFFWVENGVPITKRVGSI